MRLSQPEMFFQKSAVTIAAAMVLAFGTACATKPGGMPAPPPPPVDRTDPDGISAPDENKETNDYLFSVSYLSASSGAEEAVNQTVDCSRTAVPQLARLRIRPVHYAHRIHWDQVNTLGKTHLYAEIQVDANCAILGLSANDVAYLAVGPSAAPAGIAAKVYKRASFGVSATPVATATTISYCNYNTEQVFKPGAHLDRPVMCLDATPRNVPVGTMPQSPNIPPTSGATMVKNTGLWVSCSTGCCEVQFQ